MVAGDWPMQWSDNYRFVSDDPRKVTMKKRDAQTHPCRRRRSFHWSQAAQTRLSIISPYFVPGDGSDGRGSARGAATAEQVRILTNSLAANDVAAVHGGYSRHRKDLLEGGVQIWELKPLPGNAEDCESLRVIGREPAYQGVRGRRPRAVRRQLQPRSALDLAQLRARRVGESEPLALQLEQIFDRQTAGEHAWRVSLDAGKLHWTDGHESLDHEPHASWGRRFQAWLARTLRLDAQL